MPHVLFLLVRWHDQVLARFVQPKPQAAVGKSSNYSGVHSSVKSRNASLVQQTASGGYHVGGRTALTDCLHLLLHFDDINGVSDSRGDGNSSAARCKCQEEVPCSLPVVSLPLSSHYFGAGPVKNEGG